MSPPNARETGDQPVRLSRRARSTAPDARRVIAKPNIPVVRPARVADDGRFLRWIEYAKEALPVEVAELAAEEAQAIEKSLADIPAAIVVKKRSGGSKPEGKAGTPAGKLPSREEADAKAGTKPRPRATPNKSGKAPLKNLAGKVPQASEQMPGKRSAATGATSGKSVEPKPLDTSRFSSFEDYNDGKTKVAPLKRGAAMDGNRGLEKPKFLDGKLPRSVERGVLHPQPGRIVVSALLLIVTKILMAAVIVVLPIMAFLDSLLPAENRHLIKQSLPLVIAFLVVGAAFIIVANKARCRVCSCHFYYNRRCHKHKSAHRLFLVGPAGTAALHLLLFKWMRCMYCGTAIRLRGSTGIGKPVKDKGADPKAEHE